MSLVNAPFRFGRFLAKRLTSSRRDEVETRLIEAKERLAARESAVASSIEERAAEAAPPTEQPETKTNVVLEFIGEVVFNGVVDFAFYAFKAVLHGIGEVVLGILGGLLDGL